VRGETSAPVTPLTDTQPPASPLLLEPAGPNVPPSSPQFSAVSQDPHPSQLAVAKAVPGFGGYFLHRAGVPSVYLIDASQRPAAEQALVFFAEATGTDVTLLGILWGGSMDEANPEFVYSPMSGIERELGDLVTF
jgi:hypothetical protein